MSDLLSAIRRKRLTAALESLNDIYGYDEVMDRQRYLSPTVRVASAPARSTDPETSHLAAKDEPDIGRFSVRSRKARLLRWFSSNDGTDQQAALAILLPNPSYSLLDGTRRRVGELRDCGFLYDTGRRDHNLGSSDDAIVSAITREGRRALRRLETTGWSRTKHSRNGHESWQVSVQESVRGGAQRPTWSLR